jgi:hypothetical protein
VSQPITGKPAWPWFRLLVVCALMVSVVITWPLWNVREFPPLLPAVPLLSVSVGSPLIAACVAVLFVPRSGAIAIVAILAYAMLVDQTRMQPEFISLPILLWGSLPSPSGRLVARMHLITLWFYAGVHKLVSTDYVAEAGPRIVREFPLPIPQQFALLLAIGVALLEIVTAVLAIWPPTRRVAAWSAFALHGGILLSLAGDGALRNIAVWPWNIVLAMSGFALIAPWQSFFVSDLRKAQLMPKLLACALAVAPLGFYAGMVDAYAAHHLYSAGTARATVYCPRGCRPEQDINATWFALNVPLPPQPRLYVASFAKTCAPGDVLRIDDPHPRLWSEVRGQNVLSCPAGSLPASHP